MKKTKFLILITVLILTGNVFALDPEAPREERRFGMVYVKTPNANDQVVLESQRGKVKDQKIKSLEDVQVRVGDYLVKVKMKPDYLYEQAITVRPTERHEIIVPGFGNLRINGDCKQALIFQSGKKVTKLKCGKIRTLPRGTYDVKIKLGKYDLEQKVTVVTNTLREIDVRK